MNKINKYSINKIETVKKKKTDKLAEKNIVKFVGGISLQIYFQIWKVAKEPNQTVFMVVNVIVFVNRWKHLNQGWMKSWKWDRRHSFQWKDPSNKENCRIKTITERIQETYVNIQLHHHHSTSLRLVGTPLTVTFRTIRPFIPLSRSPMSNAESLAIVSRNVNFREKSLPEGCHRSTDERISQSARWQWQVNCNRFCLRLIEIGLSSP